MYISQNVYDTDARYIDLTDLDFFHESIKIAKEKYSKDKSNDIIYTDNDIDNIKKNQTPVFFASNLTKRTNQEIFVKRRGLKDRLRRKFLIIDADFNKGEEKESQELFDKAINLANEFKTPIVIYPSASYPSKPRYRIVFFVRRLLNATSYKKAMTWLYDQLNVDVKDQGDFYITSNNNAPIFFNDAQLDKIVDTTQDEELNPLENKLWSHIKVKKEKNQSDYKLKTSYDRYEITSKEFEKMMELMKIDSYDEFWKFAYSLLRAEKNEQITEDQSLKAMSIISKSAPNKETAISWEQDNINLYQNFKAGVDNGSIDLKKSLPLTRYDEYIQVIIDD